MHHTAAHTASVALHRTPRPAMYASPNTAALGTCFRFAAFLRHLLAETASPSASCCSARATIASSSPALRGEGATTARCSEV